MMGENRLIRVPTASALARSEEKKQPERNNMARTQPLRPVLPGTMAGSSVQRETIPSIDCAVPGLIKQANRGA
jgi:hypothetical protein